MLFRFYKVYKFIRTINATVEHVAIVMHCHLKPPDAAPVKLRLDNLYSPYNGRKKQNKQNNLTKS